MVETNYVFLRMLCWDSDDMGEIFWERLFITGIKNQFNVYMKTNF